MKTISFGAIYEDNPSQFLSLIFAQKYEKFHTFNYFIKILHFSHGEQACTCAEAVFVVDAFALLGEMIDIHIMFQLL